MLVTTVAHLPLPVRDRVCLSTATGALAALGRFGMVADEHRASKSNSGTSPGVETGVREPYDTPKSHLLVETFARDAQATRGGDAALTVAFHGPT